MVETAVQVKAGLKSSQVSFIGLFTARPRLGPYRGSGDHNNLNFKVRFKRTEDVWDVGTYVNPH